MNLKNPINIPIEASVKYTLSEYYRVVADHAPVALQESGKKGSMWFMRNIVPLIACVFAILRRKLRPRYRFSISNEGIKRQSDTGELIKTWPEISRVRVYSESFLIEIKEGAMVLPYRTLTTEQHKQLRAAFA